MNRTVDGFVWTGHLRVGRNVGRTLYIIHPDAPDGVLVGMVDSPQLAAEIVRRWNDWLPGLGEDTWIGKP